jgi:hypothetical protein
MDFYETSYECHDSIYYFTFVLSLLFLINTSISKVVTSDIGRPPVHCRGINDKLCDKDIKNVENV